MKISSNNKNKSKLLELQILKSKIYKQNKKTTFEKDKIKLSLKKVFSIIYEYHKKNKVILFVNFPQNLKKKLFLINPLIKHIFISKELYINGLITNNYTNFYEKIIKQQYKSNLKVSDNKKSFDLIVVFHQINENLVKETLNSMIPTIFITDKVINNKNLLFKQSYTILGHLDFIEEQINNNLLFSILQSILKQKILKKRRMKRYKNTFKKKQYYKNY